MAACLAAPADRAAHSLHAYFLLPGEHDDVDYEVERVRDGGSFSMRRVVARQRDADVPPKNPNGKPLKRQLREAHATVFASP